MTTTNPFPWIALADLPGLTVLAAQLKRPLWQVAHAFNDWASQCHDGDFLLSQFEASPLLDSYIDREYPQPEPALFILAEPVKCEDVGLGELFSALGPEYWSKVPYVSPIVVGESVYIRTFGAVHPEDVGTTTYRITVITCPVAAAVHRAEASRSKPGSGFAGLAKDVLEVA